LSLYFSSKIFFFPNSAVFSLKARLPQLSYELFEELLQKEDLSQVYSLSFQDYYFYEFDYTILHPLLVILWTHAYLYFFQLISNLLLVGEIIFSLFEGLVSF
jgi:hypothetical protein